MFVKKIRKFFSPAAAVEMPPVSGVVEIQGRPVPVLYVRHPRARRYWLRLRADKTVVVTVPRRGSLEPARQFVASRRGWLENQWRILEARPAPPPVLRPGMEALLRGRRVALEARERGGLLEIWLDNERVPGRRAPGRICARRWRPICARWRGGNWRSGRRNWPGNTARRCAG